MHDTKGLVAQLVGDPISGESGEAVVNVIEPNGDFYQVKCRVKATGTEIDGLSEHIEYLHERYGEQTFCLTVRAAALGEL